MKGTQVVQVISVPSSSENRNYDIEVTSSADGVRLICNCQAGQFGKLCRHTLLVLRVALGHESGIVLNGDLSQVATLVASSEIPTLVRQLDDSEKTLEDAKKSMLRARKKLERHLVQGA